MIVAIAGGALQGVEMAYLARKAGFQTILLDRRTDAPATGLCDRFVVLDLTDPEALTAPLGSVDLVLPATENVDALGSLVRWCGESGVPLAFGPEAYAISSSKSASDALFRRLGVPAPAPWPDCAFPVVAKPDRGSGSEGVEVFPHRQALEARFGVLPPPGHVLQAYLAGPSYSIEVLGRPGSYRALQITRLEMDEDHDCKRVMAPASLPSHLARWLEDTAVTLAEAVGLSGIMDVEAVLHEGQLKVLEIDARFPSQTPIAVYHSTGINMVEALAGVFLPEEGRGPAPTPAQTPRGSVLEHVQVGHGELAVCGEGIMARAGPLHLATDFFGAHEALTNYAPERDEWVATLMISGSDLPDAWDRRERVIGAIRDRFGLTRYRDDSPREAGLHP